MLNPQAGLCPQCQQSNAPEAATCSHCGSPLAAAGASAPDLPGAPSSFHAPIGSVAPSGDLADSAGQSEAPPSAPPAFEAQPIPPTAPPTGYVHPSGTSPDAYAPNGMVPPGGFGAPPPGDVAGVGAGTPGDAAHGMLPHGMAGQTYGAGPGDPGFIPPTGAQLSPPAHYGQMSGPGVQPPGMGPNPGFQHPGMPQQPWYPQAPPPAMKNNRVTLGVLAILLGSLGIHKFMLGQTTAGIIMLLISLFTCGMVSSVIGLVEGIIYLTKSDAEFYQIYEVEKKAWF